MNGQNETSNHVTANITGNVNGQVAVGTNITQTHQSGLSKQAEISSEELDNLKRLFEDLKTQVASEADSSRQASALERVDELQEAVIADTPDLTTMEYVKRWFMKNIPKLSGAVTSVIIHPIVGKLVEASGELAAEEFRQRFSP